MNRSMATGFHSNVRVRAGGRLRWYFRCLLFIAAALSAGFANAQAVATAPLQTKGMAKPNILFLLDDSGSMQWSFTGDAVYDLANRIGYRSSLCNRQYYDAAQRYAVPPDYADVARPTVSFNSALYDPYLSSTQTVNLATEFMPWRSLKSSPQPPSGRSSDCNYSSECEDKGGLSNRIEAAYYYRFNGTQSDQQKIGSMASGDPCLLVDPGKIWTKVLVSSNSGPSDNPDERQNFAIWYSYYRTRILSMKSAAGIAFKTLDDQYRIGLSLINTIGVGSKLSGYLGINDFDETQRKVFYQKLYGSTTSSGTPLRGALSKAGQIFAGKKKDAVDPMQYSCQQNFAILATDGYWNAESESERFAGYGPRDISETDVGNRDGDLDRPKYDGSAKDADGKVASGPANTLADVAAYYYRTDLRDDKLSNCAGALQGKDVCANNAPDGTQNNGPQRMKTYTIGLGINGTLNYVNDYKTAATGDYADITAGLKNWPDPIKNDGAERVDDLWHAAVNGGGAYFSAQNPSELERSLTSVLEAIVEKTGTDSAVSFETGSADGINLMYASRFRSSLWDGDLIARASPEASENKWTAQAQLDARVSATTDQRRILVTSTTAATKLDAFQWASLTSAQQGYLNSACSNASSRVPLSQCTRLSATQQTALGGENMVRYLRGQKMDASLFRVREHVLGDFVNSAPVFVAGPSSRLPDTGYNEFAIARAARRQMVYIGGNDGMLHAFDADTGAEVWAYIPQEVIPRLVKLAEQRYGSRYQYFVDGTVVVADVRAACAAGAACGADKWMTVLVGGFNAGGRGYYALDITDPDQPRALWDFNADDKLGLSFGNPVFSKLRDGTWVVLFASGYNNSDGVGYLYALNAITGTQLKRVSNATGSAAAPSGLAKIAASNDGGFLRVYGGDLLGNVWRFDLENNIAPTETATKIATVVGPTAVPQPVTTRPVLAKVPSTGGDVPVVIIGTGRYLAEGDRTDSNTQSVYLMKDPGGTSSLGNPRSKLAARSLTSPTEETRDVTGKDVDWTTQLGWFMDLNPGNTTPGERVNVDMRLDYGVLSFAGNVPSSDPCLSSSAVAYAINFQTGGAAAPTTGAAIDIIRTGMVAGMSLLVNAGKFSMVLAKEDGQLTTRGQWTIPPAKPKRISWQELND